MSENQNKVDFNILPKNNIKREDENQNKKINGCKSYFHSNHNNWNCRSEKYLISDFLRSMETKVSINLH